MCAGVSELHPGGFGQVRQEERARSTHSCNESHPILMGRLVWQALLQGPQYLPIVWPHIPFMALVSYASNRPQNSIGNYLGSQYIARALFRSSKRLLFQAGHEAPAW